VDGQDQRNSTKEKREQLESHQERGGREEEERESSLAKGGVVVEVRPEG